MQVKNTGKKCIGFGTVVLAPDAVGTLPDGYGADHPTVKYLMDKKWLTPVKGGKAAPANDPPPQTPPANDPPPELTEEEKAAKAAEDAENEWKAGIAAKIKEVGKMNLEPLRGEAFALGIEWVESDTKAILVQKITEKLQAEMG